MTSSRDLNESDPDDPALEEERCSRDVALVSRHNVSVCDGSRPGSRRYHVGDGFYFHQQRLLRGRVYMRCVNYYSQPRCSVRAVMNADFTEFSLLNCQGHTHDPDMFYLGVQHLRGSFLEACRVRPNVRLDVIYHDVCRSVRREVSSRVPLLSIRPAMVRAQNEHRPNMPQTFLELSEILRNDPSLGYTLDMETELYVGLFGADGHQSILFMSRRVVDGVRDVQHLFGDATYYARPNMPDSSQLYTLVTTRDNHVSHSDFSDCSFESCLSLFSPSNALILLGYLVVPCPYAIEDWILKQLSRRCLEKPSQGPDWLAVSGIMEELCVEASEDLHGHIRDSEHCHRIARLCLAIPLSPPCCLQEALTAIMAEARRLGVANEFLDFFQYIQGTWIDGVGDATLSVFGVRHRTNNVAESHHRSLNARVVRRPNVWRFIEMMREMEDISWRDLGRIELGQSPSRARRASSILNDARIRSCSRQVMTREMDILHFLACVSHSLEGVLNDALTVVEDDRPASPLRQPPTHGQACTEASSTDPVSSNLQRAGTFSPSSRAGLMDPDFEAIRQQDQMAHFFRDNSESLSDEAHMDRPRARRGRPRGSSTGRRRGAGSSGRGRLTRERLPRAPVATISPLIDNGPMPDFSRQILTTSASSGSQVQEAPHLEEMELHPEVFSDAESVDSDQQSNRLWEECIVCFSNVGRYMILGCGAFPVCGSCIYQWFLRLRKQQCLHCGGNVHGWVKVHVQ